MRAALVREGTLLDPAIFCVHEHIDTALTVKERGYSVYLEPSAKVTYLGLADYTLDEIPFYRERWSAAAAEASIDAFCRKWNVVNDTHSFGGVRKFVFDHVAQVDPIRPASLQREDHLVPMRRDELKQTRSDLLDAAIERGYVRSELTLIANAYHIAHVLMNGGYRPCGRPFIAHLVGTASVLVRYGFHAEIVAAGLLHAAYTHCPSHRDGPAGAINAVSALLGGPGSALERRVRAYSIREKNAARNANAIAVDSKLTVMDAELIAIAAANEVDMHVSREVRYSGRTDVLEPRLLESAAHVCERLGVPGLHGNVALHTAGHRGSSGRVPHAHAGKLPPRTGSGGSGLHGQPHRPQRTRRCSRRGSLPQAHRSGVAARLLASDRSPRRIAIMRNDAP